MAHSTLTFRLATIADAVPLARLINAAFRIDPTTQVFLSADHESVDVTSAAAVASNIAKPNTAVLVVTDPAITTTAEGDGGQSAIVAHCSVRQLDDHASRQTAWFGLLAVDPARQGQGLGGAALAWAEQYAAREWGSQRMEFDVVATRVDLIAWYERRGYRTTGERSPFPYEAHPGWEGVLRDDLDFVNLGKDLDRGGS